LSAVLNQEKQKFPNAILIDNGDSYQGSVASYLTKGAPVIAWMNDEKYSIWNIGNHEFDYYPDGLAQSIKSAMAAGADLPPIVISNMIFDPQDPADDQLLHRYHHQTVSGRHGKHRLPPTHFYL
jgi:2',3'-cyclic-nucleotide 2'-phosphodiesterase (5'-nucleotidase family)